MRATRLRFRSLVTAFLPIVLAACGGDSGPTGPGSNNSGADNTVASITVTPGAASVEVGSTTQFQAQDGSIALLPYSSGDEDLSFLVALAAPEAVDRERLAEWFEDYNTIHPHSGLRMRSPREFIAEQSATQAACQVS